MEYFYNSLVMVHPVEQSHLAMLAQLTHLNLARLDHLAEQFIWNEWN